MDRASGALYALSPVSFRYNKEYDVTQTLAFGLIAEDVAQVYPDLVGRTLRVSPNPFATSKLTRCCSTSF